MIKVLGRKLMDQFIINFFDKFDEEAKKYPCIEMLEADIKKDLTIIPKEERTGIENDIDMLISQCKELSYMMGISDGAKLQNELLSDDFAYKVIAPIE
ncbi:MAG: hypothetical protein ACTTIO_06485 [Candidatus Fimenecus sp.]